MALLDRLLVIYCIFGAKMAFWGLLNNVDQKLHVKIIQNHSCSHQNPPKSLIFTSKSPKITHFHLNITRFYLKIAQNPQKSPKIPKNHPKTQKKKKKKSLIKPRSETDLTVGAVSPDSGALLIGGGGSDLAEIDWNWGEKGVPWVVFGFKNGFWGCF
jgi:hypothetical protein